MVDSTQYILPDKVEEFAIRAALGNNGGAWAVHYTEDQKEHWRQFIRDLAAAVAIEVASASYERGVRDGQDDN